MSDDSDGEWGLTGIYDGAIEYVVDTILDLSVISIPIEIIEYIPILNIVLNRSVIEYILNFLISTPLVSAM